MVRHCSDQVAKMMLVVFNGLFLLCGVCLLIVGGYDFKNSRSIQAILSGMNSLNVAVLVVGAVVVIISLLGCCGALRESVCMLNAFLGLLTMILIAEVAVGYLAFDKRTEIKSLITKNARDSIKQQNSSALIKEAWDDIQLTMNCCGANSPYDYRDFGLKFPDSCCKKEHKGECEPKVDGFSKEGCVKKMNNFMNTHYLAIGVTAIIFTFIEIAGIVFAFCLRGAINERYETV